MLLSGVVGSEAILQTFAVPGGDFSDCRWSPASLTYDPWHQRDLFLSTQLLLTGDFRSHLNHFVQILEMKKVKSVKYWGKTRPTWPTTVWFLLICNEKPSNSIPAPGSLGYAAAANRASRLLATQQWVILIMCGPRWCAALIVFVIPVTMWIPLHYAIARSQSAQMCGSDMRPLEMLIKFFTDDAPLCNH